MGRKCSHCGNIGHNSRTCSSHRRRRSDYAGGRMKLFGFQLPSSEPSSSSSSSSAPASASVLDTKFFMKKSFSLDCLMVSSPFNVCSPSLTLSCFRSHNNYMFTDDQSGKLANGYLSADCLIPRTVQEKKKSVPWSEEEHRIFLVGLEKLGKGDWRGISRKFVTTRTPTQVASHAQKYFLRRNAIQTNNTRRPSLFDKVEKDRSVRENQSVRNECCKSGGGMFSWLKPNDSESKSWQVSIPNNCRAESMVEESSGSRTITSNNNSPDNHHLASSSSSTSATSPDLELTLAAPQPIISQTKPSSAAAAAVAASSCFFKGTITVV